VQARGWRAGKSSDHSIPASGGQQAASGLEPHSAVRMSQFIEKDMGRSQRGMAAQVHLHSGRKPPQLEKAWLALKKSCLG